jgi:transposase InsO family protein
LFGYTKQAYYKHLHFHQKDAKDKSQVKELVLEHRRQMPCLGTRKLYYLIKWKLIEHGLKLGRDKLFDLLRKEGLLVIKRRKYVKTTNSRHWMKKYPNIVKGKEIVRPEQVWVADITYIFTQEGPIYLHLITDAYSKQIMGSELSKDLSASSSIKALKFAIKKRKYSSEPLIHHSDRGLQYCSYAYTKLLEENNINISMTENGDPYENAIAERVNGILKEEFGLGQKLENFSCGEKMVNQSIIAYNTLRPHLSCNMLTPIQMHRQREIKLKTWHKKTSKTF